MKDAQTSGSPETSRRAIPLWIATTYFAQGFPFSLIRSVASVYFRQMQVSLEGIGLTSLFGLPWILKFPRGPQIDRYRTKRYWLLNTQALLVLLLATVSLVILFNLPPLSVAIVLFAAALVSATHDIAIDGFYMEALDRDEQNRHVGDRAMAYRVAMMAGSGIILTLGSGALNHGTSSPGTWAMAYGLATLIMISLWITHRRILPRCEQDDRPLPRVHLNHPVRTLTLLTLLGLAIWGMIRFQNGSSKGRLHLLGTHLSLTHLVSLLLLLALSALILGRKALTRRLALREQSHYAQAFLTFVDRPGMGLALAFIILYRAGEWALTTMVSPFVVDAGMAAHYGWPSGWLALPASIAGALWGGRRIARQGLRRWIWPFSLAQNFPNLLYLLLSLYLSPFLVAGGAEGYAPPLPHIIITGGVMLVEQFCAGLGTAVLMTFLLRLCQKEHKAAHYAIGSGLMSLSGLVSGMASGILADASGYPSAFGLSFLVTLPAMALIFRLKPLLTDPETAP